MPAVVSEGEMKRHAAKSKHLGGKRKVHEMRIKRAENGGFIARHELKHDDVHGYVEPKEYALKNGAHLMKHVKEHMCDPSDVEESAEGTGKPKPE